MVYRVKIELTIQLYFIERDKFAITPHWSVKHLHLLTGKTDILSARIYFDYFETWKQVKDIRIE